MVAIVAALSVCVISAASRILLKKGLDHSNALTGMVFSLVIGWASLTILSVALVPRAAFNSTGVLFFLMIGVVAPPVVRYLTYLGIDKLGPARADQLRSLTPFFAILVAVAFLNETVGLPLVAGTAAIFVGAVTLVRADSRAAAESKVWRLSYASFPVVAAAVAGGVANLRKVGSTILESPLLAATVAATSGMVVFAIFLLVTGKWRALVPNRVATKYFVLAGLCTGATDVLDLVALKHGRVSVVVPILATTPLFVLAFSWVFLGRRERVTAPLVLSALLIFAGVELILLFAR